MKDQQVIWMKSMGLIALHIQYAQYAVFQF